MSLYGCSGQTGGMHANPPALRRRVRDAAEADRLAREEIDLLTEVMIAARDAAELLSVDAVDCALGMRSG
jgi:hypothetical protein